MNLLNYGVNTLWALWAFQHHRFFKKNLHSPNQVQNQILNKIIQRNKNTKFGREHGFTDKTSLKEFQKNVPIRSYNEFDKYLDLMLSGQNQILTLDNVTLFEPTGGSSGGSKLVPYTQQLKQEFQQSIGVWLFDIFSQNPSVLSGKSYWSISPINQINKQTEGGTPIGFEKDNEYLGQISKFLNHIFAVPPIINQIKNIENFRFATAYFLLKTKSLSLISVWNPSFITLILELIIHHMDSLIKSIYDGKIYIPNHENIESIEPFTKKSKKRAKELEQVLISDKQNLFENIWPHLQLISCWADGSVKEYLNKLKKYFPNVFIQGKGLIATEGIISIPIIKANGCLPAFTSHFLEFLDEDDNSPKTIQELQTDKIYQVILTTSGGLYRYNLEDHVLITDKYKNLPILQFVGRRGSSDLVGEKLNEIHVKKVIEESISSMGLNAEFIMLAPESFENETFYTLYLHFEISADHTLLRKLHNKIEAGLRDNFHYKYAQEIGQLLPLRIFLIKSNAVQTYEQRCLNEGQILGDIKATYLDKRVGWSDFFSGTYYNLEK